MTREKVRHLWQSILRPLWSHGTLGGCLPKSVVLAFSLSGTSFINISVLVTFASMFFSSSVLGLAPKDQMAYYYHNTYHFQSEIKKIYLVDREAKWISLVLLTSFS